MEVKDMRRSEWRRVKQKEQIILPCSYGNVPGKISLLKIRQISEPFSAVFNGSEIVLADPGYSWVQLAMENDFAWFTAMFDQNGKFLQIYVDLTNGNQTERDNPVFEDLFLDYVVCDHQVIQLDADELKEAYENGAITLEIYMNALENGKILYSVLKENTDEITAYFENLLRILEDPKIRDLPKLRLDPLGFMKK